MNPAVSLERYQSHPPTFRSTASPVRKWLHQNPTALNTAYVALAVLGVKFVYDGLKNTSYYKVTIGLLFIGAAYASQKVAPIFIPPTHNPTLRAFNTGTCYGVSLEYHGNLPVLKIPFDIKPYQAGYARGAMMAPQIYDLISKNDFAFFTIRRLPKKISFLIDKMKSLIPQAYLKEMEGIASGYNHTRRSWVLKGRELTLDDLIYFHLLPDIGHLDFKEGNNWAQRQREEMMGCTTVIDGNEATGPRAVRTVDWIPMDVYGKYAFIELRVTSEKVYTAGQSFPLFAGFLTAMNDKGLCASINVARGLTDYPERLPAVFYLRQLVETCGSIKGENGAEAFWQTHSPLGPFNMTILDPTHAASVHFYQKENRSHNVREWASGSQLVTLNFRYGEQGETNPTPTNSVERNLEIKAYYKRLKDMAIYETTDSEYRLKGLLKGPEVNNIRTASTAYFDPKNRVFETSFDNGYAGDRPLMPVPVQEWFH